jgi:hypothetical protein
MPSSARAGIAEALRPRTRMPRGAVPRSKRPGLGVSPLGLPQGRATFPGCVDDQQTGDAVVVGEDCEVDPATGKRDS